MFKINLIQDTCALLSLFLHRIILTFLCTCASKFVRLPVLFHQCSYLNFSLTFCVLEYFNTPIRLATARCYNQLSVA